MRALLLGLAACVAEPGGFSSAPPVTVGVYDGFAAAQPVAIRGYAGSAMEPFITRDGAFLLFNNSNDKSVDTNLQVARRVDATTFDYLGELTAADSTSLDGVATVAADGAMYFVSTRSYDQSLSTIYAATFADGVATTPALVMPISRREPLVVNFDVEVSADGHDLYFVDAAFSTDGVPQQADLVIATDLARRDDSADLLAWVNSSALEYAAAISVDERELFFTRVDAITADASPAIYRSERASIDDAFSAPQLVVDGFVEGPSIGPAGELYYHHCEEGTCAIWVSSRR